MIEDVGQLALNFVIILSVAFFLWILPVFKASITSVNTEMKCRWPSF
jgi:hypothetical protein